MSRTPGFIVPSAYSSNVELEQDLRDRAKAAGFTPFEASNFVENAIEHFGVKGMKWGQHKNTAKQVVGLHNASRKIKKDQTKAGAQAKVKEAGGLHKLSEKELQALNKRMELEKKYKTFMEEESKRRSEGMKAAAKILGEIGKVALPVVLSAAGAYAANRMANNSGSFRTHAHVNRPVIDGISKTTDLVRR